MVSFGEMKPPVKRFARKKMRRTARNKALEQVIRKQIIVREHAPVTFRVENAVTNESRPIDFGTFSALTRAAITHVSQTENVLLMDLSNGLSVRVGADDVRVVLNPPDPEAESIRITLVRDDEDEQPTAALIERRLWHLRQLYALLFLVHTDSIGLALPSLRKDPDADLEPHIPPEYKLNVRGAGVGTFWIDLVSKAVKKAKQAPNAALKAISLLSGEGWNKLMRRVEALTRKTEEEARRAKSDADSAEAGADLKREKVIQERAKTDLAEIKALKEMSDTVEKIKDPVVKKIARRRLRANVTGVRGEEAARRLPPAA